MVDNKAENQFNRLGSCEVCGSENAQYTCPRCELKTCCLDCVKIHKKELECTGDRDKVGFVPLSKFTNLTLLSDYRLLEDVSRTIDNCKRNPNKKYTRFNKALPPHLYRLRKAAYERKTNLQFLPQHFTRHQQNTTILNFETKIIQWKLELIFYQANNIKVAIDKCSENERLSAILSKFVDFDKCPDAYRKALVYYHSTGLSGLDVLLKAENVKEQPSFFQLDLSCTLKENFEDRIIIEYPVLYVIFKSHIDEFKILDPNTTVECTLDKIVRGKPNVTLMPNTYFNKVSYSGKVNSSVAAHRTINECAAQLRKYFGGCGSGDDEEDDDDNDGGSRVHHNKPYSRGRAPPENVINVKQKESAKAKELNIPFYDNLIKQNN